jgi:hypothetical protein
MEAAAGNGYRDCVVLEAFPDFAAVRSDPRFKTLASEFKPR